MKYCTTAEIAERWNISDRRVRVLCQSGRLEGVVVREGTYLIPCDAVKPADGRYRAARLDKVAETVLDYGAKWYLKWQDDVVAFVFSDYSVRFVEPCYNAVVESYTHGESKFDRPWFESFLGERIVSSSRRDIEKILLRCGLHAYDVVELGLKTRGINSRDLLWIAFSPDEKMENAIDEVFRSVFELRVDLSGNGISTPEGNNVKRYGVYDGKYGIYKKRISPLACDVESEIAVFELGKLLGVDCCPVHRVDEDTVFSEFVYDWGKEYLVHMRRLFAGARGDNEYLNLLGVRPQYQREIAKMVALDFVTRQDDRHLSNVGVLMSGSGESFYPLYDNGRSLFYEDTEETAALAVDDVALYATTWGASGTYCDYVREIADAGVSFGKILNLNVTSSQVHDILVAAGFKGYRLKYAELWVLKTIDMLKEM